MTNLMLQCRGWRFFIASVLIVFLALPVCAQSIDREQLEGILKRVDGEIELRDRPIKLRRAMLSRQRQLLADTTLSQARLARLMALGEGYRGFNNDSAMYYFFEASEAASRLHMDSLELVSHLKYLGLLPLAGFSRSSITTLDRIDTTGMSRGMKILYHSTAHQVYQFVSESHTARERDSKFYRDKKVEHLEALLAMFKKGTLEYDLLRAETFYNTGDLSRARAVTSAVLDSLNPESQLYARMAYLMALIEGERNATDAKMYYLAKSTIADIRSANLEIASMQELGRMMFDKNDINRAYSYLSTALKSAVESRAEIRIIETGGALALIEAAHNAQLTKERRRTLIFVWVLVGLVLVLGYILLRYRGEMRRMAAMRLHLEEANSTKEVYISQFLKLCSIYMDKLNQFCKLANRKISTGKVDDLYRLTKSGKFIEEQSQEFFDIFDNAFLHLYPDFALKVNRLLRPDETIELAEGERLNTDLRILALMRLGIEESGRIAELLNYSVNTIYAYRNKLKNRARSRDTFEEDVMKID